MNYISTSGAVLYAIPRRNSRRNFCINYWRDLQKSFRINTLKHFAGITTEIVDGATGVILEEIRTGTSGDTLKTNNMCSIPEGLVAKNSWNKWFFEKKKPADILKEDPEAIIGGITEEISKRISFSEETLKG